MEATMNKDKIEKALSYLESGESQKFNSIMKSDEGKKFLPIMVTSFHQSFDRTSKKLYDILGNIP